MGKATDHVMRALHSGLDASVKALVVRTGRVLRGPPATGTPRDTHWHRSNWVATAGEVWNGRVGTYDQAKRGNVNLSFGHQSLEVIRLAYTLSHGDVYLTNNATVIARLNEGWSAQSPAGFVPRAIESGLRSASRAFRRGVRQVGG